MSNPAPPDGFPDLAARLASAGARLEPCGFADLPGWESFGPHAVIGDFWAAARAVAGDLAATRPAQRPEAAHVAFCRRILSQPMPSDSGEARRFAMDNFAPHRVATNSGEGFVTGYYEPEVDGAWSAGAEFGAPILGRPDDLVTFPPGHTPSEFDPLLAAARRRLDGSLVPYPDRLEIETQFARLSLTPLVWLRDWTEVFLVQVQGSARVRMPDGACLRLGYAGRNGLPYTSIGRILIESGAVAQSEMSLARLKLWLRENGQGLGEPGRNLMQRNRSYVFFKIDAELAEASGPIGAAGLPLTPLQSIAVDRNLWPYGLPFWLDANLPWAGPQDSPFQRLMLAQDTGSAILGPVRADIYFGSGEAAGVRAGGIRHPARFHVLLPRLAGGSA